MFNRIIQQLFKHNILIKTLLVMTVLITLRNGTGGEFWEWWTK